MPKIERQPPADADMDKVDWREDLDNYIHKYEDALFDYTESDKKNLAPLYDLDHARALLVPRLLEAFFRKKVECEMLKSTVRSYSGIVRRAKKQYERDISKLKRELHESLQASIQPS